MDSPPLSPNPAAFERGGQVVLAAGFGLALLITVGLAWTAPLLALVLPLGILAVVGGLLLFRNHRVNIIVWMAGFPLLLSSDVGFQVQEVVYGLYFFAFLGHWYGRRLLLYRRPLIEGVEDRAVALWLVLGLSAGVVLGLLFGANPLRMRGEVLSFVILAMYFPVKEFVARDRQGPVVLLILFAWIGIYVTIDNAFVAQQRFAAATQVWEIADIRTSGRELLLTFAALLVIAAVAAVRGWRMTLLLLVIEAILFTGLILTKSRGFWVAFAFGAVVFFAVARGERTRLLGLSVLGLGVLGGLALLLAGPYLSLLIVGIKNRLLTLGGAGTDLSLLNRFVESEAVRARLLVNPILGYGLGTEYTYYRIIEKATLTYSYIHNGYLAVWYKFGLWGVALVATAWGRATWCAWRVGRSQALGRLDRMLGFGVMACLVCMSLPTYTTNVFFEDEKLSAFTLVAAIGCGLYQRMQRQDAGARQDADAPQPAGLDRPPDA